MRTSRLTADVALLGACVVLSSVALSSAALAQSKLTELPPNFGPGDKGLKWGNCPEGLPKGCQLAVLNGDPAKPGADVFLKLPAKSRVPAHKHTSAERIVVVEGDLSLTYDGHKPMAVKRGTYHYGPAEAVHEAQCVSAQPCVLFISFEKPVDLIPTPMAATAASGSKSAASAGSSTSTAATAEKKPKKGGC